MAWHTTPQPGLTATSTMAAAGPESKDGGGSFEEVVGDLFEFESLLGVRCDASTRTIVAHVTNTEYRWGAGFVVPLGNEWPDARATYMNDPKAAQLGHVGFVVVDDAKNVVVANMSAQKAIRRRRGDPCALDYGALRTCLKAVHEYASKPTSIPETRILMPRIGAGLAGGDWAEISKIIEDELCKGGDYRVVVFELPGAGA